MINGKTGILAQNPATHARKLRLRWILAASALPMFAIITAFGIAPNTSDLIVPVTTVVEAAQLPASLLSQLDRRPAESTWQIDQVKHDDTLSSLMDRLHIREADALDFLRYAPEARSLPTQLRPGRSVMAKTSPDGDLLELDYQITPDNTLQVKRTTHGYHAEELSAPLETRTLMKSAEIQSSLFAATDEAGIPDAIAMQIADIFSSDIDFHLDLRRGDHLSVIYEASYNNGEMVKSGRVLAAELINHGMSYHAMLYVDRSGHANYYSEDGRNLRKSFLRSPLEFSRISSGFSLARFHPLLHNWRAHKGVDYAAPIGTGIKATADGTVTFVGSQGGYGNMITLQHAGNITTVYGHLSRFAAGLRKGQRISQGQIIGQVGMTGLATGPHLHYEFRVHGEHRDPVTVALPAQPRLSLTEMASFRHPLSLLALLQHTNTAALD